MYYGCIVHKNRCECYVSLLVINYIVKDVVSGGWGRCIFKSKARWYERSLYLRRNH